MFLNNLAMLGVASNVLSSAARRGRLAGSVQSTSKTIACGQVAGGYVARGRENLSNSDNLYKHELYSELDMLI